MKPPHFPLGSLVATPAALKALESAGQSPAEFLAHHAAGDWGDVDKSDWKLNDAAVGNGERILSAYRTNDGTRLWIITEADRSSTCILLPEEY
jgi:hypothetical protein